MNSDINSCDLCDALYDIRLEGANTECGACVCGACADQHVTYRHIGDECFTYLNEESL
jgi:hypothetical protein